MEVVKSTPSLVHLPHPVTANGKSLCYAAFLPGETLGAYLDRIGLRVVEAPMDVWQNGRRVPSALWRRLIPRQGDQIIVRAKMEGGGGGGKILRTVALVALVIVSAGYGAALGGALGFTGATAGAIGSSVIMLAGTVLINALLPMPLPTAAKLGAGQKYESSPTYAIQGGRNRPRPWEPLPIIMGRHRIVPDLGANTWTNQLGDDQFLNQVFNFGLQGMDLNLRDFKIGNTPIESYDGVQMQRAGPDGVLSMFPGNVDTLQGFSLNSADGWQSRTTPPSVYSITVELASRLFRVADDGSMESRRVDFRIQYRQVGATDWLELGYIDAVYATHYWSARLSPGWGTQVVMGTTNFG
ncbi:phage tail protein, partial [Achromobacter sp. AGC78]